MTVTVPTNWPVSSCRTAAAAATATPAPSRRPVASTDRLPVLFPELGVRSRTEAALVDAGAPLRAA